MKILSIVFVFWIIVLSAEAVLAQRTKKTQRKSISAGKALSEVENWQIFDSAKLKLKISFPKTPTVDERKQFELQRIEVQWTTVQTFINGIFYLLQVREYPKNTLPKRDDLGENYADYLKTYILNSEKIISEKPITFGKARGTEFVYQDYSNSVIIQQIFVIDQKLLQMMVQMEIRKPDSIQQTIEKNQEKLDKFFESLQLYEEAIIDKTVARIM